MATTLIGLYVLLLFDAAFSGICAASGRNALIYKRRYYLRSMWHGIVWGNVMCLGGIAILGCAYLASSDRVATLTEMNIVGRRMVYFYTAFAAVTLVTFLVRTLPSVDIRSLTSTLAFGPLTIMRPPVILAGVGWGLLIQPSLQVALAALGIGALMIPFRVFLNHRFESMPEYTDALI